MEINGYINSKIEKNIKINCPPLKSVNITKKSKLKKNLGNKSRNLIDSSRNNLKASLQITDKINNKNIMNSNNELNDNKNKKKIIFKKKKIKKKSKVKKGKKRIKTKIINKDKDNDDLLINSKVKNIGDLQTQGIEQKDENINKINNNEINLNLIRININKKEKYTPKDSNYILNNYTFSEAMEYDLRPLLKIFYIYILKKETTIHAFLFRSPMGPFPLRLSLLIFIISSDLALNAFLYLDDFISKKYKYAKGLFLFTLNNNISIVLLSTLIGIIFITIFNNLINPTNSIREIFRKEEEKIQENKKYYVSDKRKKEIITEVQKILKKHKIKSIVFVGTEILLTLFFWYYVTAFCHVYSHTQTSWILDSFLSIISRLFIEFLFSMGFAKLYRIAVGSNLNCLYKFVLFAYCYL